MKEGIEGTDTFLSPGKGRGLKALKHFKVGDLVFACPAYAYVLTVNERGAHCELCFTRYVTQDIRHNNVAAVAVVTCV